MHARRIFIPPGARRGREVAIPPAEAHYLRHVLRMRAGGEVAVFDGAGWTARAEIRSLAGRSGALSVIEERLCPRPPRVFSLALAVLKAPAMDLAVRACTELGASAIAGFAAERSVPRAGGARAKEERWRRIALEACRQCGHEFIPSVAALDGTPAVAALFARHDAVFVASLREGSAPLWGLLARPPANPLLIVGPEGDFAPGELDFLLAAGARPCRLSGPVLRAETAAAAGAAILAQAILLRTQWKT